MTSIRATPDPAGVGRPVELAVAVANPGAVAGGGFVTLWWEGAALPVVKEVAVPPGGTATAIFSVVPESAGDASVAAALDGGARVLRTLAVVAPDVRVASWTARDAACADELTLEATVANAGGFDAATVALDAWSVDADGRTLGHASVDLGAIAAGANAVARGALFAPDACREPYTLLFVVGVDGAEAWREVTAPFVAG